jgi:hypothetical protein
MLANHRQTRENASRTSHGSRRYSARQSDAGNRYREKAQNYYNSFGNKVKPERAMSSHNGEPMTPQHRNANMIDNYNTQNFYIKNAKIDENTLKLKGLKYLDKKGILANKVNKRYFKDNDLTEHLKVNKKQ